MNSSQKLSRDWRIGFLRNVPTLIWIGIIIALAGVFLGLIVTNIFPPDEFAWYASYTFGFHMLLLSHFIFYGGLGLVILGIFMYIITRFIKPGE